MAAATENRDDWGGVLVGEDSPEQDDWGGIAVAESREATVASAVSSPAGVDSIPTPATADPEIPQLRAAPTFLDNLRSGQLGDAAKQGYEALRRQVSGIIGPTEAERIEQSIEWGKDEQGNPVYQYKPLANRMEREAGLFTPYLKVEPLAGKEDDSLTRAAGKALFNQIAALEGMVLSPGGVMAGPVGGAVPALGRTVSGGFALDMATHLPAALNEAMSAPTAQGKIEGWLGVLSTLGFTGLAGTHATGRNVLTGRPIGTKEVRIAEEAATAEATRLSKQAVLSETQRQTNETLDAAMAEAEQMAQPLPKTDAIRKPETIQPDENVLLPQGTPESAGQVPAAEGGAGVSPRGQGAEVRAQVTPVEEAAAPSIAPGERPEAPQAEPPSERIVGTALSEGGEPLRGSEAFSSHQDISKEHGSVEGSIARTGEAPDLNKQGGFIARDASGKERFVSRTEATKIAKASGQVPETKTGELHSQDLKDLAEAKSEGPGAAAETEPLASYEKRRFGERFQESKDIIPEIREATGNRYYEPIPNAVTVKEAEAIIEARGTDEGVRLVRDEGFPMDHRVRSTMAQGLIKKLNQSHAEAAKAGDTKAAEGFLNQAVDTAEYLSELGTKLGQGVQSFAIWSRLTPEGLLMAAKRTIRKARASETNKEIPKDLDPDELAELTRLAAEIDATPEGFQRHEKMTEFLGKIADMKGVDPADIPTALWYANILSGYSTQLVNTIDTGLNVFSEAAAMAASHPSAVPDILSGLYRGMVKGGMEAADTLKTGRGRTENKLQIYPVLERARFGEKGGVPISTNTVLGRVMKAGFEKKPAKILNLWKYPLRAMVASDTVFYNSFKEARSRVLARAMAKKEGLSRDALFRRVDEILNQTPEKIAEAQKQAEAEGLTGNRLKRRVREIQEQGRPEELVSNADEAAQIATYNHDPTGTLGVIAAKIGEITQNVPVARAIVPFTRIVANVANRGLDYTPWGYKRLFFGQHGGERFAAKPPVGEAYRTQLIKATAGTVGMTALAALDAYGIIQVTASGPHNSNERNQLSNSGWKPYSVKVGDTWISYQYTPLNLGLAMVGHYRDAIRYNKLDEKDAQTRLAYGMLKSGSTLFDMSFLSGLSSFIETVSGSTSSSSSAGRMIARTGSSLVTPNLLKQIDRLFDPTLYDANSIQQMLIRETPVARSTLLQPTLNVLGEPVKLSNNRFFSFDKNDPVWKLIVEKQAFVPVPSKTRKVGKRPITEKEYRELIEVSGKRIKDYIQTNLGRLQSMKTGDAQKVVDSKSNEIREAVMKRFSEYNPKK